MLQKSLMKGGKRCVMLITLLLLAVATFAVPAKPGLKRLLTLTDGTTVTATLVGDEYAHYWLGADGKAYRASSDGVCEIADLQAVRERAAVRRSAANQHRTRRLAPRKVGEVGSISGDKKGIIILVNFTDKSFTATQNDFYKLANQVNYNSGNYKGSMYDYFYAQSEGQFRLTFDVVGPYTVSQNYSYYGKNNSQGDDMYPAEMVIEALKLADPDVNYADYDWDGDGEVDQVYIVYAGKGEADGGASNTIWPHEWTLTEAKGYGDGTGVQQLDGVYIDTYACGGEKNGETGATAGIGTMCHEFSHCLGYPDFYDTKNSGGQGMGYWDLMDNGSYNGDGYQPAGYTSYERWVAGWKTPIELVYTQTINDMAALQTEGCNTYIIYNKGNNNEYYLLENRQKIGWDTGLPGAGLLILHVDYNASAWADNTPNGTASHQRMTWVAADNKYQYTMYLGTKYYSFEGMANDPFPYGSVNAFGKSTTPAAKLFNINSDGTKYLDSSVEDITQNSDGTISFNFNGIDAPAFDYYQSADGKMGEALKTAMSAIILPHTQRTYDNLWTDFFSTDVRSDGKIWDMYSNITDYTPVTSGSSYSKEGDCYNREHSFPQSWFNNKMPMYTDLHHIYPTDGFVNGKRGNNPFGETNGNEYKSANDFSKLGKCTYPGYTGIVFEPADEYKGDFARTYFYMVTCYEENLAEWYAGNADGVRATIDGSTYPALQTWQLEMLMKWAKDDPVSEKEINRNEAVYAIQNNRNPFIDYPGLQEYIWGTMTTMAFSYNNYKQPVYTDIPDTESGYFVKVTNTDDITEGDYLIVYEDGGVAFNGSLTTLDATDNTIAVTITDDKIPVTDALVNATFTIQPDNGTIKSASGYYIGQTSNANGLASSENTAYTNTFAIDAEGNADIVSSSGPYLRFNSASNQNRFRYYKSSTYTGQKAIQLYKYNATDNQTTSIEPVTSKQVNGNIYNLNGQRVTKAQKGLYIINGRKVVIK